MFVLRGQNLAWWNFAQIYALKLLYKHIWFKKKNCLFCKFCVQSLKCCEDSQNFCMDMRPCVLETVAPFTIRVILIWYKINFEFQRSQIIFSKSLWSCVKYNLSYRYFLTFLQVFSRLKITENYEYSFIFSNIFLH